MAMCRTSVALTLLFALCVVVAVAAAAAGGNQGKHNGWYKIKLDRDFKKGAQPFNGKGHKSPKKLPIDPRTGMVYTGSANRSQQWYALTPLVAINVKNIQVWADRPVPLAVAQLINDGTVDPSLENDTTVITNDTCNHGGKHCQVVPQPASMAPQQVRISEHRVLQHGDRREHVIKMSTVAGSCGVTAALSFTPDATTFSLLFNNFNVETNKVNNTFIQQQSTSCAFRVPITVPMGLTVAALTSQLRGYALSTPQGQASISWTAGIGMDMDPNAWADIYDTGSYSARYWSGGVASGADFDPITVAMELDSVNPTFSPCGQPCATCATSYDVPIDFQFTLNAIRSSSEANAAHPQESLVFLDSQDTSKSITMNQPYDFELC